MTEEKPQEDNPYSPTFCVYPWMEMLVGPNHGAKICCIARNDIQSPDGRYYNNIEYTLEELWNCDGIRSVREKMLKGEKVKECSYCYYQESIGMQSYRQSFNQHWFSTPQGKEIHRRVEKSKRENFYVDSTPLYLDIRPGNKCNLKCRMCNPGNSSKIFQEQEELLKQKKLNSELIETGYFGKHGKEVSEWHKNPDLWKTIDQWLPNIRKFYFTGGEPTLIEKNWQIIDRAIEGDFAKDIVLDFNINCTYVPDRLLRTFDHFSHICLNLSVDGFGSVQEYIRYPSKWKTIERNISKILNARTENVEVWFSPVIQVYNILRLTEFFEWRDILCEKFETNIRWSLIICTTPEFLDIASLPQGEVRKAALSEIKRYKQRIQKKQCHSFVDGLKSVEYILENKFLENTQLNGKRFFEYTKVLDEHRGNDFSKSFPRLNKLLKKDLQYISDNVNYLNVLKNKIRGIFKENVYR